jgi:hypothetical protein
MAEFVKVAKRYPSRRWSLTRESRKAIVHHDSECVAVSVTQHGLRRIRRFVVALA